MDEGQNGQTGKGLKKEKMTNPTEQGYCSPPTPNPASTQKSNLNMTVPRPNQDVVGWLVAPTWGEVSHRCLIHWGLK